MALNPFLWNVELGGVPFGCGSKPDTHQKTPQVDLEGSLFIVGGRPGSRVLTHTHLIYCSYTNVYVFSGYSRRHREGAQALPEEVCFESVDVHISLSHKLLPS